MALSARAPVIGKPLGDLNGDFAVDPVDVALFAEQWLDVSCEQGGCRADLDGVAGVTWSDFAVLAHHWRSDDLRAVVISEILAHSDNEQPDWIELYNNSPWPVDIGGWFISDSLDDFMKYEIAPGTRIEPFGYRVFYEDLHFNNPADPGAHAPFGLSENGEVLSLHAGVDGLLGPLAAQEPFGASERGVSLGRYRKSTGSYNFVALSEPTPGRANTYPKIGPLVINEIMYHPPDDADAEYVELVNISDSPVTLYDVMVGWPWRFTDDPDTPAVDFMFPTNPPTTLGAGQYLLLVKNLSSFDQAYDRPVHVPVFEWGAGRLDNAGEKIQLRKPGDYDLLGTLHWIEVDRVNYGDSSASDPWPADADGLGPSLSRIYPQYYGNDPNNWQAAVPTPGQANP